MGAQEDYARFSEVADDLQLEDDEKESFIASAMKRKGYKPSTAWNDPEPDGEDDGKDDGDFFSAKREKKQREKRDVSGSGEQKRERFGY